MKSLLTKSMIGSAILLGSTIIQAGIISDYSLDKSNGIVTDKSSNLEWLQWSTTDGLSINQALNTYQAEGWKLASNAEMAGLFNDFNLSYDLFSWDDSENTTQSVQNPSDGIIESEDDRELQFVDLFGSTRSNEFCGIACIQMTGAIFGNDADGDGLYNFADVLDDYNIFSGDSQPYVGVSNIYHDSFHAGARHTSYGVALVRVKVESVNEPSTIALLGLGLLGVGAIRKKAKS